MSGHLSFFNNIRQIYGEDVHRAMKQIAKLHDKVTRYTNRKKFLTRCRANNLIPQHIQLHVHCLRDIQQNHPSYATQADKIVRKFKRAILNLEIKTTYQHLREIEHLLKSKIESLKASIPGDVLKEFLTLESSKQARVDEKIKMNNINKLNRLRERVWFGFQHGENLDKRNMVVNLTDNSIPGEVMDVLALGPKFAVNPPRQHKTTYTNLLTDAEYLITQAYKNNEEAKNQKRQVTNNILTNFINKPVKIDPVDTHFQNEYRKTKSWLTQNVDMCITTADKGNKTVIMSREQYSTKMTALLSDPSTYQIVQRDPSNKVKNSHNELIKKLTIEEGLHKEVGSKLICHNGILGRIYGQVKLHKPDKPLRPIISTIGTTNYKTAKYMSDIIRRILGNTQYDAIDSFKLASRLRQISVPDDHILVSFGVINMFTNIPTNLVLQLIDERWNELKELTTLNKTQFCDILNLIFENCFFTYNNNTYKQIRGLPMGSSLSPALADLVLEKLISSTMAIVEDSVSFMSRYVDDLLLIIQEDQVDNVLAQFNSFHPNVQFTIERELDKKLNFLELTICRNNDNTLTTTWFRKTTASLRYMNFYSNHSLAQKISIIRMLGKRLQLFCGSDTMERERDEVFRILKNNDYPSCLINRYLDEAVIFRSYHTETIPDPATDLELANARETIQNVPVTYYKLPAIKGVSTQLRRALQSENIKISFYHSYTVGQLYSNMKDKIPISKQSNIVYKLTCDCGSHYIGQSKQHLSKRLQQHQASLRRMSSGRLQTGESTGITQHMAEHPDHTILFDDVTIVEKESNYLKRLFKEALNIQKTQDTMNLQKDVQDHIVTILYSNVISKMC